VNARKHVSLVLACCIALVAASPCAAAGLVAGPMAGHGDAASILIWFQGDAAAQARIEYWPDGAAARRRLSAAVPLTPEQDFTAQVPLTGLAPGTRYRYRVLLDGREAKLPHLPAFRTEGLWQWQRHSFLAAQGHVPQDFKVAFGACSYFNDAPNDRSLKPVGPYGGEHGIFDRIAAQQPDIMLWLGDSTYLREADYGHPEGIARRFARDRAQPELQALLRTGRHYAIWDDHDFGPNDANASFTYKDKSLEVFKRYWANGAWGQPETPGVFRVVSYQDADFFLTDGRYHRDADAAQGMPHKAMLGAAQMRWLKNALLASTANFKIIVSGTQVLRNVPARIEGWSNFPEERREFLDWLADNRVAGVLFLSGDRHHTVLSRQVRENAYPLHDFTCSPLTAGVHGPLRGEDMSLADEGTLTVKRNFCTLEFGGSWVERRLTMRAFDAAGSEQWKREIGVRDLRY
jgi:alkaline phosphatase D